MPQINANAAPHFLLSFDIYYFLQLNPKHLIVKSKPVME